MAPPETLWETRLGDGSVAKCVLVPARRRHGLVWYANDEVQGVEEFATPSAARRRARDLRDQLAVGAIDRCQD